MGNKPNSLLQSRFNQEDSENFQYFGGGTYGKSNERYKYGVRNNISFHQIFLIGNSYSCTRGNSLEVMLSIAD